MTAPRSLMAGLHEDDAFPHQKVHRKIGPSDCSGSMIPDTNVGGNIATINEVSDDQKATFFFS